MRPLFVGIQAVVFDAVGTLIYPDPPAAEVYARVGRSHGSRLGAEVIPERFAAAFARQEALDRTAGWRTSEEREVERWHRIVAEVLEDVSDPAACFQELFEHFSRSQAWHEAPDVGESLSGLAARGYRLALASNYDSRLRTVAAGLPALGHVRDLIISSEVGWRKPAALFFAAVCRQVELAPQHVLYVGDDFHNDYEGSLLSGLRAVLLETRSVDVAGDMVIIGRLADLLELA